ncbi:MAG TPA: cytochrome c [Isosphaeraceae bacterium]|nr:cytochrome c [Isosphaeraceae bacterium]
MFRLTFATSLLVVLGATVLAASSDDKTPTIEQIMDKLHKGANSPLAKLKKGLASNTPDWKAVQKSTKQFATLGAELPKNEAPKGDQASFKKLADAYASSTKALDDAAQQEELAPAKAAFRKIGASCKACHTAHRPD